MNPFGLLPVTGMAYNPSYQPLRCKQGPGMHPERFMVGADRKHPGGSLQGRWEHPKPEMVIFGWSENGHHGKAKRTYKN